MIPTKPSSRIFAIRRRWPISRCPQARAGPVEIAIQLEDGDERPLTTAHGVSVTLANPDNGIAPVTAIAEHVSDDKWVVRMDAPQPGRWSLDLGIKLSATDGVNIAAPILIR